MRKVINKMHINGYLYQHDLVEKVSGEKSKNPGTSFITGTIEIATDDDCINVVPVHYTYVTPTTKNGGSNNTYIVLKNIISGVYKTVMSDGKDKATKIVVDTAIDLNEFFSDRSGKEELVSVKRNEGGFIHVVNELEDADKRNKFNVDMLITGVTTLEATENRPEKMIVKGAIFNYRQALLPVEFSVVTSDGFSFFESLGASNKTPVFLPIAGQQISETIKKEIVKDGVFGGPLVQTVTSSNKDYVITWADEPYGWDTEDSITAQELTDLMTARQTYVATLKARNDEFKAQKNTPAAAPAVGGFNF
jgi:hypothetical protein